MGVRFVFWDVDTQHDFMDEDGRLPVPQALSIVPNLRTLTQFAASRRIPIVASADAHRPGNPELAQFGEHCMAGTPGQRKIAETSLPGRQTAAAARLARQVEDLASGAIPQLVIEKQELNVFSEPAAETVLSALAPQNVVVYGVATEYCVRVEALGIRERGYPAAVVTDAVKAIDDEAGRRAIKEMQDAGVELVDLRTVLSRIRRDAEA
jgi:nicotinamidase/pyrazinamidase